MKKITLLLFFSLGYLNLAFSQGLLLPLDNGGTYEMERYDIQFPKALYGVSSAYKPYRRQDLVEIVNQVHFNDSSYLHSQLNNAYLINDNWWIIDQMNALSNVDTSIMIKASKSGLLGVFYKQPKSLFSIGSGKGSFIEINPLIGMTYGRSNNGDPIFENTRGISLSGSLDNRFYFHSEIKEVQRKLPKFAGDFQSRFKVVPHAGNYKKYESPILNIKNGLDYNYSNGYLGFNLSKHFGATIGHGKHFIGNGIRSLLLSDFGMNYFYAGLKWNFGKLQYHNLYTVLKSKSKHDIGRDGLIPKKYMSAHYLNVKVWPNLEVGIFESVVFSRNEGYELEYLNPIILFRSVESNLGSPDNVLLGTNIKWNIKHHWSFYGQLVLDEFKLNEIIDYKKGWWANKWGIQTGMKYINMFDIDHLDLQVEYNIVRPYVYTHRDSVRSYAHYNQGLAHPWGANFKELLISLKYQPTSNLQLETYWINACRGLDEGSQNNGSDILRSYYDGIEPYGNTICQGIRSDLNMFGFNLSYQFYHNYNLDFQYIYRNEQSSSILHNSFQMFQLGLRINLERYDLRF